MEPQNLAQYLMKKLGINQRTAQSLEERWMSTLDFYPSPWKIYQYFIQHMEICFLLYSDKKSLYEILNIIGFNDETIHLLLDRFPGTTSNSFLTYIKKHIEVGPLFSKDDTSL